MKPYPIGFISVGLFGIDTVTGRSPAPPAMYKTLVNNGIFTISNGAGFLPSRVWFISLGGLPKTLVHSGSSESLHFDEGIPMKLHYTLLHVTMFKQDPKIFSYPLLVSWRVSFIALSYISIWGTISSETTKLVGKPQETARFFRVKVEHDSSC